MHLCHWGQDQMILARQCYDNPSHSVSPRRDLRVRNLGLAWGSRPAYFDCFDCGPKEHSECMSCHLPMHHTFRVWVAWLWHLLARCLMMNFTHFTLTPWFFPPVFRVWWVCKHWPLFSVQSCALCPWPVGPSWDSSHVPQTPQCPHRSGSDLALQRGSSVRGHLWMGRC